MRRSAITVVLGTAMALGCASFHGEAGTPDAAPPADAAAPSCGVTPFHDDFERNDVLGPWTRQDGFGDTSGLSMTIDGSKFSSPSRSLKVVATHDASGPPRAVYLSETITPAAPCIDVTMRVFVDPTTEGGRLLNVHSSSADVYAKLDKGADGSVILALREQAIVDGGGGDVAEIAQSTVPTNTWIDVELRYEPPTTTLVVAGTSKGGSLQHGHDPIDEIRIGCTYTETSGALYWIDDVSVR